MGSLGNSSQEQALLRPIALWAANHAEQVLVLFENKHPDDLRPRQAIQGGREFGLGKKRDKNLRMLAFAAMKSNKDLDQAAAHVVQAAVLTAAIAYTHTDLQSGTQGIRQAKHILGPVVHAALAFEAVGHTSAAAKLIESAIAQAPAEAGRILEHLPPQPQKANRADTLFYELDNSLRRKQYIPQ